MNNSLRMLLPLGASLAVVLAGCGASSPSHAWSSLGLPQGAMPQTLALTPGKHPFLYLGTSSGVLRSRDGRSWKAAGLSGKSVLHLAVDPRDRRVLLAATLQGLYRSTDGGRRWIRAKTSGSQAFHQAIFDPGNPSSAFAGVWAEGVAGPTLWASHNGGISWQPVAGLPRADIDALSFSPGDRRLYVGTYGYGLFVTTNAGKAWRAVSRGLPLHTDMTHLAIDPADPQLLYEGTHQRGIYRSRNGGKSWQAVNRGLESALDIHALAVDPRNPSILFAGDMDNSGGAFVSRDGGRRWTAYDRGLGSHSLNSFVVDATDGKLYAVTMNGLYWRPLPGA
jgi:photosystem II stability/assembly factor-like uncharacterized protein